MKRILTTLLLCYCMVGFGQITPSTGWKTTGNSGTTSANFIGTTDARDFVVKVRAIERARWNAGSGAFNTIDSNGSQVYTGYQYVDFGGGLVGLPSAKCVITKGAVKFTSGVETIPLGTPFTQAIFASIDTTNFNGFYAASRLDSFVIQRTFNGEALGYYYINTTSAGFTSTTSGTGFNFLLQPRSNDGNVGIGVASPATKLHIDGQVRIEGLDTYVDDAAAVTAGKVSGDLYIITTAGGVTKLGIVP